MYAFSLHPWLTTHFARHSSTVAVSRFLRKGEEMARAKVERWKAGAGLEVEVNVYYDPVGERWEGWYIDEMSEPTLCDFE